MIQFTLSYRSSNVSSSTQFTSGRKETVIFTGSGGGFRRALLVQISEFRRGGGFLIKVACSNE